MYIKKFSVLFVSTVVIILFLLLSCDSNEVSNGCLSGSVTLDMNQDNSGGICRII